MARQFPHHEQYGLSSQLRRAALSVPLNVLEGYSRQSVKSQANFLRIAYGSLKESIYLIEFAVGQNYAASEIANPLLHCADELAGMIWSKVKTLSADN